ncbi:MAG: aldehyde dehydrogenase family protein [Candidatus Omnitrophota bacterium]
MEIPEIFRKVIAAGADGSWRGRCFIGGEWVDGDGGEEFAVISPVDGRTVARLPKASAQEALKAIASADTGSALIREIAAIERIKLFGRAQELFENQKDFFKYLLLWEAGKPAHEAAGEVEATIERLRMTMQEAKKISGEYIPGDWSHDTIGKIGIVMHEPVGIVAAITPFNYPLYIPAAKIIPALLAGNAVVVKPASAVPLTLLCFARLLEEAGFPKGSINVVTGSSQVGDTLVADPRVHLVSFTGSTEVGQHVARTAGLKKLHLELGGKGVAIVLEDADLDLAAKKCVEGSLKNAGQRCDAISSVLAVGSIADELVGRMREVIAKWPGGDPRQAATKVGPLINEGAARRVSELIAEAVKKGAKVLCGGACRGAYLEPTLLDEVSPEARIAGEETFGPVVCVIRVKDEEAALEIASRPNYGLDSCVFTKDYYRMWKLAKRLEVGGVTINDMPRHGVGYFPFGGVNKSGIGREGIGYSIEEMTQHKTIVFNLEPAGLGKKHLPGE